MICFNDVTIRLQDRVILDDLKVELSEKRIGIIGLNGSGKSTFARLINGLQIPSSGSVTVNGFCTKKKGRQVRRQVGFVFQNPENQIVYPTVEEDLAFGLKNLKIEKTRVREIINEELDKYDLSHLASRLTHQLSGGEKQMVALIGVLIMAPQYLVMDEPTTLLDLKNKNRLMSVISGLEQSVLLVTHDLDLLNDFDRVLCIHDQKLVADGSPAEVKKYYQSLCGL
ncbi:energy-coupling factor ABC transporter ATP-binding protein [Sneathiella aquimaris]|uniref:energy-coupling factor ABC transporter ATP-binding protein n=1 Tax=Sneathiella aquimaris TaxID=2599305 RepID=UPI00146A8D18|nr:ABC transporter ATP-binding protein [Sneathiella aquimaris]